MPRHKISAQHNKLYTMETSVVLLLTQLEEKLAQRICSKVGHADYCEDILQEVYLKMLQRIHLIEKADNIVPYVMRLADNTVVDYYRKWEKDRTVHIALSDEVSETVPEAAGLAQQLSVSFISEMVGSLPPIYQEALVKTEFLNIPQKRVAEELGISYSGLKSRVQRAKQMLRIAILACCDFKFDKYGNIVSCCGSDCN